MRTGQRGSTRIDGVPAGAHTVAIWHETLGKATKDVTVKPGETVKVAVELANKR